MRILFLAYNFHESFSIFSMSARTGCPWIDSLLDEFVKEIPGSIGLAVPTNDTELQKGQNSDIALYGLPAGKPGNLFEKSSKRLLHAPENNNIISYVSSVIEDFNPDIIQVFGTENPFGLITSNSVTPVIIHIQGLLEIWKEKWFSGFTRWEQLRYARLKDLIFMRGSFNEYFSFKKRARRELEILRNCKYFIGRTGFDRRVISLLSPGSSYFHCDELLRKDFYNSRWDCPHDATIRCISILKGTTYKGLELLVRTMMILKKQVSLKFEFTVCGVSPDDEIVRFLKKKFKISNTNLKLNFTGKLDIHDLIYHLLNSFLYINPSHIENSPNSVCEAMLLGLPVISTSVGGVNSLITNGVDGILVQEGEPYAMAAAILELAKDPGLASSLGQKARERALRRHDPEEIKLTLMTIYKSIVMDYVSERV